MMITKELKKLVDQMPDPDDRGMYTKNIDKEKIESATAAIFAGGPDHVQGLVDMLGEPGSPENVKPHYALHCVLNHALSAGDDEARRQLALTVAKNLSSSDLSRYNKGYLCQELQWMGREEAVDALGRLLLDEQLVEPAAMALAAIKTGAVPVLRDALADADGICRRNIVDALAALEDPAAAEDFQAALDDGDVEVRIAARAGLSKIPKLAAAEAMLAAAHDTSGWERIQAAKSCLIAAETLAGAGQSAAARQVYDRVISVFDGEAEAHIRSAAEKGNAPTAP